jgi:transcriptional regulator with XRE-family HTH domain
MDNIGFWTRVKEIIKANKTSQKKVAETARIPLKTFQGWITKELIPPADAAYYIARILGVSVEYLLTGKQKQPPSNFQIESLRKLLKEADNRLVRLKG